MVIILIVARFAQSSRFELVLQSRCVPNNVYPDYVGLVSGSTLVIDYRDESCGSTGFETEES